MSDLTDPDLVRQALGGDPDAFANLVRRHHPDILGLCISMLHDASLADDAAQEAFLKAYRSLDKFRMDSSFSTWLYRIASNTCLDFLRRKGRERSQSLDSLQEGEERRVRELFAAQPEAPVSEEDADLLERVLARLPEDYRLILTLREIQGLDYKELAETLDCSLDAVKARLKRARQRLEAIARHFSEPGDV